MTTTPADNKEKQGKGDEKRATVSDRPRSDYPPSVYSSADLPALYSSAQWVDATLIHNAPKPGQSSMDKGLHKLPIREPDGTLNRAGVHAAAQTLAGARQGVNATDAQRVEAAQELVQIYKRDLREEPPESLVQLAGSGGKDDKDKDNEADSPRDNPKDNSGGRNPARRLFDALFAAAPLPTIEDITIDVDVPEGRVWPPPSDWFRNPELTGPTPLTVIADGRVFGHLATWGTQHLGAQGVSVTPPRSRTGYSAFWRKMLPTSDGELAKVGFLTMDIGHADIAASAKAAASHYDNTEALAAAVSVGEDEHGIYVTGATLPHLPGEKLVKLSLATLSGDWRNGELCAALAVNVPGFGIPPSEEHVVEGRSLALVAAGALPASPNPAQLDVPALASAIAGELDTLQRTREEKDRDEAEAQAVRDREQRRERARRSVGTRRARASASLAMSKLSNTITASALVAEGGPGNAARLKRYWAFGPGAAKIRWGTDGDLTRCHRLVSQEVAPGEMDVWGYCQNLHKARFGRPNPKD